MRNKYSNFFAYFLILLLLLIVGIISINASIDYTGIFGSNLLSKDISLKTDNRRLVSPGVIRKYTPEVIITGTSRAGRGLNPLHNVFENQKTLNLFLNAGDANEIGKLLNFASLVSPPKKIVLGVDFFSFDSDLNVDSYSSRFKEYNYENSTLIFRIIRNLDLLLSKESIRSNLSILKTNKTDFEEYSMKSFHDASYRKQDIALIDDIYSKAIQVHNATKLSEVGHGYYDFQFSFEKLDYLTEVLKKLKNQGVEIKVFMSPIHVYFMESIIQLELFSEYSMVLSAMSELAEDPLIEFYDFSGFNEYTAGKLDGKVSGYFPDAGHYSEYLGNKILEKMFKSNSNDDFGKLVSTKNLQNHLNDFEQERLSWRTENPNEAKIIDKIIKFSNDKIDNDEIMKLIIEAFYEPQINSIMNSNLKIEYCDEDQSMAYVKAGEFIMGAAPEESLGDSLPLLTVNLASYCIDVLEVTNFDFQKEGFTLSEKTPTKFRNDYQPVVNVNWLEAKKFCNSIGKRLPTEEEWEKAARGVDGRRFPWGNNWPSCHLANFNGNPGQGCGSSITSNVGNKIKGISPYGVLDMAGNVFEFVNITSPDDNTTVIKGGGWSSEFQHLPSSYRRVTGDDHANTNLGFRCAKSFKMGN